MDIKTLVELIIISIATWRLTSLIVNEDGPWFILLRIRMLIGIEYYNGDTPMGKKETIDIYSQLGNIFMKKPKNEIANMLTCMWCASIWVGAFLTMANFFLTGDWLTAFHLFVLSLAASGAAIKIEQV